MSQPTSNDSGAPGQVAEGYAEALAELETILAQLERTDVDVDVLAAQVKRAAALIGFCRDRIGNARMQIEQVVAELGTDE
ncbi:MAG TPA: exodeoxyribonuclease VII small subunit [Ilumatobacteraceae bacterium]|nr:exodeoxyribonuclease VII small subunit [Ilumatobacteraceae bacterium]HRB04454.1 exodeoxyribonuclease VII small subunit [Ilumatobacteraceae bacterium]